jgi:hypothetical protein
MVACGSPSATFGTGLINPGLLILGTLGPNIPSGMRLEFCSEIFWRKLWHLGTLRLGLFSAQFQRGLSSLNFLPWATVTL